MAQTAPPTLEKVKPSGGERGTRVTVTIEGTNIAGATRMIFSEPGLSSEITATKEIPVEKPEIPKGVVRTDAPIEDKAKAYEVTARGDDRDQTCPTECTRFVSRRRSGSRICSGSP